MNAPLSNAVPLACQIRAARSADSDALASLLVDCFHRRDGLTGWLYPFWRLALREDIRNRLRRQSPDYCCLVAVMPPLDGHAPGDATASPTAHSLIVGTIEMTLRPQFSLPLSNWFQSFPYLSNLAVMPGHRRQGIARRMIQTCETVAKQWGHSDLYLHVLENNQPARALYASLGFSTRHAEFSVSGLILGQPRQLLLHKSLNT